VQNAALFSLYSLYFLGEFTELTRRYTRLLSEAEERGNILMSASLRAIAAVPVWLAADDPDRARHELAKAAEWTQGKFSTQWRIAIFRTDLDLYAGDGAGAYKRVEDLGDRLKQNFFLFVQYVRALTAFAQGRAALASLDGLHGGLRKARLAEARRLERRVEREQMPWTATLAAILRAGRARAEGDPARAAESLRTAIERARASEMAVFEASARLQLGLLLGGDQGAGLVHEAEDSMAARGVRAPARFAAVLVPGRWGVEP
jgi:hypothetical protein